MRFAVTAIALSLALGCGAESAPDKKQDDPKKVDPKGGTPTLPTPTTPDDPKAVALKAATDFYATVKAGKATPDQLTVEFKKVVAPPLDREDPKGYSDDRAREFLARWTSVSADALKVELVNDVAFCAGAAGPNGRVLLRLLKDGGAWKADWLSNGPPSASPVSLTGGDDTVAVLFAVTAFTDAAIKKDHALVAGLMNPAARERIAPPRTADKARGFNPGILKDEVERAVGKAESATVTATDRQTAAGTATVKLDLTGSGTKSALTLKLIRAKPGVWLVDGFETK